MSAISARTSSSTFSTGEEICRRRGSGTSTMGRMAMAFNMAGMPPISTRWRLPKLDRISLRVMDPGEAADAGIVPFRLGNHVNPGPSKLRQQHVQPVDAQVEHGLPVRRKIVRVGRERREDGRSSLLLPLTVVAAADAKMLAIPFLEGIR